MTEEELKRVMDLIVELAGPTYTFRAWTAQPTKKGREKALQGAAAKIDAAVRKYVADR